MGQSIKNRVFGSDIPVKVKKKIEARQRLAYKAPSSPGEQIESEYLRDADGKLLKYKLDDVNEMNFGGIAELSSRTPFVRMWTSVKLSKDIIEQEMTEEEARKWNYEKYRTGLDGNLIHDKDVEYKDSYLRKVNDKYEKHKWENVGNFQRIYVIGNHVLNTLEKEPNTPISEGIEREEKDPISAGVVRAIVPVEQETDFNKYLKPAAGITGLSSATEGAMGVIKKTTVNFIVHNFADFESIYLRYFLKPGAQVFIDFGWDTAYLYDIKKLLEEENIEDFLFGDSGYVTRSAGDLETLIGHVVNYDAKVREDGGFDCSVEIVSKNTALLSNAFDPKLKERVKYGLDIEALGLAVSGVLGDPMIYQKASKWNSDAKTESELRITLELAAAKLLGGRTDALPGTQNKKNAASMLALEHGVFYAGSVEENMKLFINFGWFEDKFLNKEFGFSDTQNSLINKDKDSVVNDEATLKAKFNSRNSFCVYNESLREAMTNRGFYEGASFLYPETWGSYSPTYNTKIGMVADGRDVDDDGILQKYKFGVKEFDMEAMDKKNNRIPLREIFLSVDMIKESMDLATSSSEFFKNIMDMVKEASGGLIDLALRSNSYSQHTLAFIDKNHTAATNNEPKNLGDMPEFLKKLLIFKPYSRNTIVKEYNLSFNMPQGGLGNILAIQSAGSLDPGMSINQVIDGFVQFELLHRNTDNSDTADIFVRYNPSIGEEAGIRFERVTGQQSTGTFNFSKDEIAFGSSEDTKANLKKLSKQGFQDVVSIKGKDKPTAEDFAEVIKHNLNLAADPNRDLDGTLVEPKKLEEDTPEDTKKAEEDIARSKGHRLVNTPYEYYIRNATHSHSLTSSPLIQIEAFLKIYGISSLVPGDLIRINYLPKNYLNNVYFQITKVSHDVGTSWDTSLTTQMRICPLKKDDKGGAFRVRKSYLRNVLKLNDIDSFIHLFDNLMPVKIPPDTTNIDHKFICETAATAEGPVQLPTLDTHVTEKVSVPGVGKLLGADKKWPGWATAEKSWKGLGGLTLNITFDDYTDLGIGYFATGGFKMHLKNFNYGKDTLQFYIYTSGSSWIIVPVNAESGGEKIDEMNIDELFSVTNNKIKSKPIKIRDYKPKIAEKPAAPWDEFGMTEEEYYQEFGDLLGVGDNGESFEYSNISDGYAGTD